MTKLKKVLVPRTFHLAPLSPSDLQGDTSRADSWTWAVGTYGPGAPTLAEALPPGVEFILVGSGDVPKWARRTLSNMERVVGRCSGVVLYREPEGQDVKAVAFGEYIGDRLISFPSFETRRYLDPGAKTRHDRPYTHTVYVNPRLYSVDSAVEAG